MNPSTSEKLVRNLAERRKISRRRAELLPLSLEPDDLDARIKALTNQELEELADLDGRAARLASEAASLWAL
jgi:hypothetical protein